MEVTKEIKDRILAAIRDNRENYPSDNKHAAALGISASVYNSLKKGITDRLVSDTNWICLARRLNVSLQDEIEWKAAETPTFQFITEQLRTCQESGVSALLCDLANIGKTFTARAYVKTHRNAIYVDCSQVKNKSRLIRLSPKSSV